MSSAEIGDGVADFNVPLWRILDAAANRADEGLRVVEDYVRFALDDRHLTELAKQLRHELAAVLRQLSPADRIAARDTGADVGIDVATADERRREDAAHVASASSKRLQQALRSLEEYSKVIDPRVAAQLESLRYRAYTLERAVAITSGSGSRLANVQLYVLLDGRSSVGEFTELATNLIDAGVHAFQLRDKRLADRELLARARRLREATAEKGVLLIVNDRPDLARLSRADGVHVGQDEMSVKDARAAVGPGMLVGVSTHSLAQARQAVLDGANYLGVGPTFRSTTKQFDQFTGLDLLRQIAAEIRLPAFAIGGIGPDNLSSVLETGIRRIAVGGAILSASDPIAVTTRLSSLLTGPIP